MTVSSYIVHQSGPSGKLTAKSTEYTRTLKFKVTDPNDGPVTIFAYLLANGPFIGSTYSEGNDSDGFAYLEEIDVPQRENGSTDVWVVRLKYKTPSDDSKNKPDTTGSITPLPWNWRPEVSIGFAQHQEPCYQADYISGFTHVPQKVGVNTTMTPVNSTLAEAFDPPIMRDQSRMVIRIRSWSLDFSATQATAAVDRVNKFGVDFAPFLRTNYGGVAHGLLGHFTEFTLKVANVDMVPKRDTFTILGFQYVIEYFEINTEVHYDPHGWRDPIVDRGTMRIAEPGGPDGRGGTFSMTDFPAGVPPAAKIIDADGMPVGSPVLLDGAGNPKALAAPPVYITYRKYEEVNFASLPFTRVVFI